MFYPGGHGPLWDLATDPDTVALIEDFVRQGKPVAAVCHAPAVLLRTRTAEGQPLVAGRQVTGFSNSEEDAVGLSAVVIGTWLAGATRWESLLSALVGLAFAGGLIWSVRIIAGRALGVEAMGFGDVTLMAMIGTFLGWQAAFLVFFLAPLTAVLIAPQSMLTVRAGLSADTSAVPLVSYVE